MTAARLTHVDLFAGVGGFTLGFEATGLFETKLLADSDQSAATTFKRNRPRVPYWVKDLSKVEATDIIKITGVKCGELDVLTAGPPCQGLSRVGTRQLDDPRNELLRHTAELLAGLRPRIALIENVPALAWEQQSSLFEELRESLAIAGYWVAPAVLDAWRFGVPQLRRRLFLLAVRSGELPEGVEAFPEADEVGPFTGQELIRAAEAGEAKCPPGLSVEEAIGDLPSIDAGGGDEVAMYASPPTSPYQTDRRRNAQLLFNHRARVHSPAMLQKIEMIDEGGRNQDLPDESRLRAVDREYFSQAYARLHRHGIAQTITTYFHNPGSGRFIHYRDRRSITVREAARFQSFDDDFMFLGKSEQQMRHVGNAVPVLLAKSLAAHLAGLLGLASPVELRAAGAA
jgi:DNA (cytosine-5)-methyltransferase 1